MDVLQAIAARRAIKRFDPDHRLAPEDQDRLLEAARQAPTAFNLQHYRFVVVTDPALRRALRLVSFDQSQVTDASLLVVVCANLAAWRKDADRCWQHVPEPARAELVGTIRHFYADDDQLQRDEAMRSAALAAQNLMLAGKGLGLDSCPMDGYQVDDVARLIGLPGDHLICMYVALGRALEAPPPRASRLPRERLIIENRFRVD